MKKYYALLFGLLISAGPVCAMESGTKDDEGEYAQALKEVEKLSKEAGCEINVEKIAEESKCDSKLLETALNALAAIMSMHDYTALFKTFYNRFKLRAVADATRLIQLKNCAAVVLEKMIQFSNRQKVVSETISEQLEDAKVKYAEMEAELPDEDCKDDDGSDSD